LKKRQQSVFLQEALQGNAWLARDAGSKRFEMGRDDLLKRKLACPNSCLKVVVVLLFPVMSWYLPTRELNVSSGKL
jgi:hypothetical protein